MIDRRQQFEKFVRMIVEGRSDLVYRAYVIEDTSSVKRIFAYRFAGLIGGERDVDDSDCNMAALKLQRDLIELGYPVISMTQIDEWVKQFWNYYRISNHYRKGKKRPPEEVQAMYERHKQVTGEL